MPSFKYAAALGCSPSTLSTGDGNTTADKAHLKQTAQMITAEDLLRFANIYVASPSTQALAFQAHRYAHDAMKVPFTDWWEQYNC